MSNLQTYNPNSSNHDDYSIVVTVINSGYPDDPSLTKFPQVTVAWNVSESYCVNTGTDQATSTTAFKRNLFGLNKQSTGSKPPLRCPGAVRKVFRVDPSLPLRDNISGMLHDVYMIRFPLDNLRYHKLGRGRDSTPLDSVDDMVGVIERVIVEMLSGGRKKLQVNVRVQKQIRVSLEEYQARAARAELEDRIKHFFILMEQTRESARDLTNGDFVIRQSKQIAVQFWKKLSSLAATAGLNIDNTFYLGGNAETLDLNQMQMQLALLVESLSLDFDAMMFKPTPASRGSVESLRKFWKIDGVDYGANSEYCVVCMDKMVSGIEVTCMPCEHMFHGDCIVQWLGLRHTCPVCRFELPSDHSKRSKARI